MGRFAKLLGMTTTTPARYSAVVEAFAALEDEHRPGRVLDLLARMMDLTDAEIAGRSGFTRATINAKRRGKRKVRPEDIWPLSEALDVEWDYFLLCPHEAAGRLLANKSAQFRCTERALFPSAKKQVDDLASMVTFPSTAARPSRAPGPALKEGT